MSFLLFCAPKDIDLNEAWDFRYKSPKDFYPIHTVSYFKKCLLNRYSGLEYVYYDKIKGEFNYFEKLGKNKDSIFMFRTNFAVRAYMKDDEAKRPIDIFVKKYEVENFIELSEEIHGSESTKYLLTHNNFLGNSPIMAFEKKPILCTEEIVPRMEWDY